MELIVSSAENTNVVTLNKEKEDAIKMIIMGLGLKTCRNSYRDTNAESAYKEFIGRDLVYLSQYWEYIDEDIQIDIIRKHKDFIFSLIKKLS